MCGIAGFFSGQPLAGDTPSVLEGMLDTLQHRGPDGRGCFVRPDQGIAMGHTRLSINDLETGDQPILGPDGKLVLTTNGEFYDSKRYRSTLMAQGDRFRCKSDSEIALGLYRHYGLDCVRHLRGEFAFALYDPDLRRLLLVRDRFGVRPLFYRLDNGLLVYGSEAKALLAHPAVPRRLCPKAALNQLMQTIVPGTSAFEGIHGLEPGHWMTVTQTSGGRIEVRKQRYWDLEFPRSEEHDSQCEPREHIERIRDELIRAPSTVTWNCISNRARCWTKRCNRSESSNTSPACKPGRYGSPANPTTQAPRP